MKKHLFYIIQILILIISGTYATNVGSTLHSMQSITILK